MKTYKLKKIDILSYATIMSAMMGLVGIIYWVIYFFTWNSSLQWLDSDPYMHYFMLAYPVILAIAGFVTGTIQAFLLNVIFKYIKTFQFTLSEVQDLNRSLND